MIFSILEEDIKTSINTHILDFVPLFCREMAWNPPEEIDSEKVFESFRKKFEKHYEGKKIRAWVTKLTALLDPENEYYYAPFANELKEKIYGRVKNFYYFPLTDKQNQMYDKVTAELNRERLNITTNGQLQKEMEEITILRKVIYSS